MVDKDDIIRMAKEVGIRLMGDGFGKPDRTDVWATQDEFECFAALVAAAEREACAKIVEMPWQGHYREVAAQIRARGQR